MQIIFEGVHGNDTVYMDCLRAICGDTEDKSMIDLCCNLAPHTPILGFSKRRYVDILHRNLDHKEEQQYFVQMDILKTPLNKYYDISICSDGIEHLTKNNGYVLLDIMENISGRKVIFTPLGNHMVEGGDNPESHHSGWYPEELKGYASIVFPNYHPTLGIGAFYSFRCENLEADFERVKNELKDKTWHNK